MSNISVVDGTRTTKYMAADGTGTDQDPYKIIHKIEGTVDTGLVQPVTDAEIRATPIPIIANSTTRTPTLTITSTSGTIASGCVSVSVANTGNANGTLLGQTIAPGVSIDFIAPWGDTIGAIAYDATSTTFLIQELR